MKKYLLAAVLTAFAFSACASSAFNGISSDDLVSFCEDVVGHAQPIPPPEDPPVPPPSTGESFVISAGITIERRVKLPAIVEFDITPGGMDAWDNGLKGNFLWVYKPGGKWTGGRSAEPYEIGVRSYKVKAMWLNSEGKMDHVEPRYGAPWTTGMPIHVRAELTRKKTLITIGAGTTPIEMPLSAEVMVGVGWPPTARPGMAGARVDNLVFMDEATF